ncbi:VOC family protein [Tritonibacter scottomollicae]|uniref:VOC family protein n=1 Tax=Tritonibacter scottomollicae TaxID=483013 RepID=UPI003BAD0A9A
MQAGLGRIILYTKHIDEMVAFYTVLFGYTRQDAPGDRIVELRPSTAGIPILLHPAARSQKQGQACVKLVFDVADVSAFCADAADAGFAFGTIHDADGYQFSNCKDPSGNSVSVSSRAGGAANN